MGRYFQQGRHQAADRDCCKTASDCRQHGAPGTPASLRCVGGHRQPARDHAANQRHAQKDGFDKHAEQMADDHRHQKVSQPFVDGFDHPCVGVRGEACKDALFVDAAEDDHPAEDHRQQHKGEANNHQ